VDESRARLARADHQIARSRRRFRDRSSETARINHTLRASARVLARRYRRWPGSLFFIGESGNRGGRQRQPPTLARAARRCHRSPRRRLFEASRHRSCDRRGAGQPRSEAANAPARPDGGRAVWFLGDVAPVPGERRRSACRRLDISDPAVEASSAGQRPSRSGGSRPVSPQSHPLHFVGTKCTSSHAVTSSARCSPVIVGPRAMLAGSRGRTLRVGTGSSARRGRRPPGARPRRLGRRARWSAAWRRSSAR